MQNNLIPGEVRTVQVPLLDKLGTHVASANRLQINGKTREINANSVWPIGVKRTDGQTRVMIDYDAMLYRPLD